MGFHSRTWTWDGQAAPAPLERTGVVTARPPVDGHVKVPAGDVGEAVPVEGLLRGPLALLGRWEDPKDRACGHVQLSRHRNALQGAVVRRWRVLADHLQDQRLELQRVEVEVKDRHVPLEHLDPSTPVLHRWDRPDDGSQDYGGRSRWSVLGANDGPFLLGEIPVAGQSRLDDHGCLRRPGGDDELLVCVEGLVGCPRSSEPESAAARSSSFAIQVVLQGLQTSFVVGEAISLARQTWVTASDSVLPMWHIHSGSSSSSVTGNTVFSQSLNKCSPSPWAEGEIIRRRDTSGPSSGCCSDEDHGDEKMPVSCPTGEHTKLSPHHREAASSSSSSTTGASTRSNIWVGTSSSSRSQ